MTNITIETTNYEINEKGEGRIEFTDGSLLILLPYHTPAKQFDSALLYQKGNLEALATDIPAFLYKEPMERGFWSNGIVNQQELAHYWDVAFHLFSQLFNDTTHTISDEELKNFETILRGSYTHFKLEHGEMPVLAQIPERFENKMIYGQCSGI